MREALADDFETYHCMIDINFGAWGNTLEYDIGQWLCIISLCNFMTTVDHAITLHSTIHAWIT